MVRKQPVVAELPAEEVAYKQDRDRRRGACHVSLVGAGRKGYGMAVRLAVPFEPGDATSRDRHRRCFAGGIWGNSNALGKPLEVCSSSL
jgi:hypothetical protein